MNFKAADIAAFLNGELVGDSNVVVSNVSKIEEGRKGTLTFLANLKYEKFIYQTSASIVLVNKNFIPKENITATLVKVDDPYKGFAALLDFYFQTKSEQKIGIEQPSFIDKTATISDDIFVGAFAYIGKNTKIGKGVKIYPQTQIGENVSIGDNCIIYSGAKINDDVIIGKNCIIHLGVVIGSDGFGFVQLDDGSYKKIPQIGNVIIEDDVEIGANSTIDCGTLDSTIIRKGVKIDNLVQIAHNCEVGENTAIAAQTGVSGSTKIGKNCIIGGQVGINGHITIGDNCVVGAQSGVTNSLKDGAKVWGTPTFNYRDSLKSHTVFKNLPQMQKDIFELQKHIKSIKTNKKDSSN